MPTVDEWLAAIEETAEDMGVEDVDNAVLDIAQSMLMSEPDGLVRSQVLAALGF